MKAYFWQYWFHHRWFHHTVSCIRFGALLALLLLWTFITVAQQQGLMAAPVTQPVVHIQLAAPRYDEANNRYLLSLSISNPGLIDRWILKIEEKEAGKQVHELAFTVEGRESVSADFDGRLLVDEREYVIKIEGVDYAGKLIQRPDENNTLDPGERTILATREFKHQLPKAAPITASILSVNVDFANGLMLIDLDISDDHAVRVSNYTGWVIDKESGARLYDIPPGVFTSRRLQEKLPTPIAATTTVREYELILELTTKDDQKIRTEPRLFKPTPPPPPGFFSRLNSNLGNNPMLLTIILIVLVGVVTWLILQNNSGRRGPLLPPRPPLESPTMPGTPSGRPPALRLTVVQTSHPSDKAQKVISHFPCDLGREGCHVNFPNDALISRRHAQITWRGGHYYLADLDSRNGTYINDVRQPPHQPKAVNELSTIRLGKNTVIKVEPAE
jgi:hypothetical protein